jgi:hypothetical protein
MSRARHPRTPSRGSAGRDAVRSGNRRAGRPGETARCRDGSPARSGARRGCGGPTTSWQILPARRCPGPAARVVSNRPVRYFRSDRALARPRRGAAGRARCQPKTGRCRQGPMPIAPPARRAANRAWPDEAPQGWCRFPAGGVYEHGGVLDRQGSHVYAAADIQVKLHTVIQTLDGGSG